MEDIVRTLIKIDSNCFAGQQKLALGIIRKRFPVNRILIRAGFKIQPFRIRF